MPGMQKSPLDTRPERPRNGCRLSTGGTDARAYDRRGQARRKNFERVRSRGRSASPFSPRQILQGSPL
jgi:hypothetical protein